MIKIGVFFSQTFIMIGIQLISLVIDKEFDIFVYCLKEVIERVGVRRINLLGCL